MSGSGRSPSILEGIAALSQALDGSPSMSEPEIVDLEPLGGPRHAGEEDEDFTDPEDPGTDAESDGGTDPSNQSSVWDSDEEEEEDSSSLARYIHLSTNHCRAYMSKVKDDNTALFYPGVCGCDIKQCKYESHVRRRVQDEGRAPPGWYLPVRGTRGINHGRQDVPYIPNDEYLRRRGLVDQGEEDTDEEGGFVKPTPRRSTRIQRTPTGPVPEPQARPSTPHPNQRGTRHPIVETVDTPEGSVTEEGNIHTPTHRNGRPEINFMGAGTGGPQRAFLQSKALPTSPVLVIGLENPNSGQRQLTEDPEMVHIITPLGFEVRKTFADRDTARRWKDGQTLRKSDGYSSKPSPRGQGLGQGQGANAAKPPQKPPARNRTSNPSRRTTSDSTPVGFDGYKRLDHERIILQQGVDPADLVKHGYRWIMSFPTQKAAEEWRDAYDSSSPTPTSGPNINITGIGSHGGQGVSFGVPGAGRQTTQSNVDPRMASAQEVHIIPDNDVFAVGQDPSSGDKHAFYHVPANQRKAVDEALLPVGANRTPQGTSFVNRVYSAMMDVTALPEDVRGTGDTGANEESDIQILAETLETVVNQGHSLAHGINTSYKSGRHHSLARIKSRSDLLEFQADITSGLDTFMEDQKARLMEVLLEFYWEETAVARYCDFGQLPRLIYATLELFKQLLETAAAQSYKFESDPWVGSMAATTLSVWGDKLKRIRVSSPTYRQHLVRTYILLRDAKKAKFHDHKISEEFMAYFVKRTSPSQAGEPSGESVDEDASGTSSKCNLCGHPEWHSNSKNCLFRGYAKSYVRRLIKDVESKKSAISMFKTLKEKVDKDKDDKAAINKAIDEIRAENMSA